jgi:hypothetical protein
MEPIISETIKPVKKRKLRFNRGSNVLCVILEPGEKHFSFIVLRKEEKLLTNKTENQKFLIEQPPSCSYSYKEKSYPLYICDSERGVTVDLTFERASGLALLFADPKMISNVFDESFISKASGIKPDFKQLLGVALMGFVFGGLMGLMF